jgi:hypothetical protein
MTQTNEANDRDRSLDRQLRILERRLTRLEETQLTGREVNGCFLRMCCPKQAFDQVCERIYALEDQMEARFDLLEARFDRLEMRFNELDRKLDIALARSRDRTSRSDD